MSFDRIYNDMPLLGLRCQRKRTPVQREGMVDPTVLPLLSLRDQVIALDRKVSDAAVSGCSDGAALGRNRSASAQADPPGRRIKVRPSSRFPVISRFNCPEKLKDVRETGKPPTFSRYKIYMPA